MENIEAIRTRRSVRSFKPVPIPKKLLEELLDTSRWSPSSRNTQPWEFVILGGKVLEEIKARIEDRAKSEWDTSRLAYRAISPDVPQPELTGPYLKRAGDLRDSIDIHQFPPGTEDIDKKRFAYLLSGTRFFDAPNAIIVYIDKSLYPKALFDAGMITQTICLAALSYGLGTCTMTTPVNWADVVREALGIADSKIIVTAIAIGYPKTEALLNTFKRSRESLDAFVQWQGF
jgi:nitroreductase